MINKELIKNNFSRCAPYYDKYSSIQNLCAARLIAKIKTDNFTRILELGCGTGNYTRLLKERFPEARIKAIDISSAMARVAEEKIERNSIEFIVADAETIGLKEKFDLISSNASLQWFEDLGSALAGYRDMLQKNGLIFFSIFGPGTFFELNECLQELSGKCSSIDAHQFIEKKKIKQILKKLFRASRVERKVYREQSLTLSQLLKKIKYTGTRGRAFDKKGLWTDKMLNRLERIYKQRFKAMTASYEVFFCKGIK